MSSWSPGHDSPVVVPHFALAGFTGDSSVPPNSAQSCSAHSDAVLTKKGGMESLDEESSWCARNFRVENSLSIEQWFLLRCQDKRLLINKSVSSKQKKQRNLSAVGRGLVPDPA